MSNDLPYGYQDDNVFDNIPSGFNDKLSGYSSDDGGEFPTQENLVYCEESEDSEDSDESIDEYFQQNQEGTWNERFQSLVEIAYFRKGEESYSAERQYELSIALRQLCIEFANKASKIGVRIVKQMFLPPEQREIRPITNRVGGVAGGEKYLHKSIFFKFPVDSNNLYGGDFFANKTAEHELKGLMSALDCRVNGLYVPLTALINYRGYSLIAQSWLPVDNETIVYGTSDGGNTIHSKCKEFNGKMKEVGEQLNLKPHDVWNSTKIYKKKLYGPADLEGHLGHDNRFYILDCSRLFPPCAPDKELKSTFLYRLLRPEFLKRWKTPLSSDAFSKIGLDYNSKIHNQEVREASIALETIEVPSFAKHIDELRENKDQKKGRGGGIFQERLSFVEELSQLVVDMRLRGINTRYLLLLLYHVKYKYNIILVTTELIARHIKNQVRETWRNLGKNINKNWQNDTEYIKYTCLYFNSIFGTNSTLFWENLPNEIKEQKLPHNNIDINDILPFPLKDYVNITSLFIRLEDLLGIQFTFEKCLINDTDIESYLLSIFKTLNPFKIEFVSGIIPKIKYINRITFEEGTALSRLAVMCKDDREACKLLESACIKYKESLAIRPNDTRALYNWGLSLSLLAGISQSNKANNYYNLAAKKYKEALVLNPKDRRALFMWANMLIEQSKTLEYQYKTPLLKKACQLYNQALDLLLNNETDFDLLYNCGVSYLTRANVLTRLKKSQNDEIFRLLSIACKQFISAIKIQPNSINAIHNLAVSTAKRARTLNDPKQQINEYQCSFKIYSKAESLAPKNENILFDWGNALYRHALSDVLQNYIQDSEYIFNLLCESFLKYYNSLLINPIFESAFINLCLVLSSLVGINLSTISYKEKLCKFTNDYISVLYPFFPLYKNNDKFIDTIVKTLSLLYTIYKSFPELDNKLLECFKIIDKSIPEYNNKKSGSDIKNKTRKGKIDYLPQINSSTTKEINNEYTEEEIIIIKKNRRKSCPIDVDIYDNQSNIEPRSNKKTLRKGNALTRFASKILRRKHSKKYQNQELVLSPRDKSNIMNCSQITLNWNDEFLYNSTPNTLDIKDIIIYQRIIQNIDYSIFIVTYNENDNSEEMLLLVFDENRIEKSTEWNIIEHPCIIHLYSIFHMSDKLYMLYNYVSYPFLSFFKDQKPIEYIPIYLAELLLIIEYINVNVGLNTFKLSYDRLFVDSNGHLKLLYMNDWNQSNEAKETNAQQGLKYSSLLYSSPEQLKGIKSNSNIIWSFGIIAYQLIIGKDPYEDNSVHSILKLMNEDYIFKIPSSLNETTYNFLQLLLTIKLEERLVNINHIKEHSFFNSIDWDNIYDIQLPIPKIKYSINTESNKSNNENINTNLNNQTISNGQPLDTLIAPALKNEWAGFTLNQANIDNSQ